MDSLKPFTFHNVYFHSVPKEVTDKAQAIGSCPFCPGGKTKKFHVNVKTQLWDCKHCGRKGNLQTFLEQLLADAVAKTTNDHYKELGEDRYGIPWKMFQEQGWGLDIHGRWLIPILNARGTLINLAVYQHGKPVFYTGGIEQTLGRLNQLASSGTVILCEGPSDAMAMERLRRKAGNKKVSVLYTPSAGTLKADWVTILSGREVTLMYDADSPGETGMENAAFKLQGKAKSVHCLKWPAGTPDGWDIRDQVHHYLDKEKVDANEAWDNIIGACIEVHGAASPTASKINAKEFPSRKDFKAVMRDVKKAYYVTPDTEDALWLMFAVNLSVQMLGDPLWMFFAGPPGTGKTVWLRTLEKSPFTVFKSSITPRSLVSGYVGNGDDPSLIPQLTGKCLILKDYTEILTMSQENQEEMYGILRGAYDGRVEKTFGNGAVRVYPDCYFGMMAGVTDVIHGDERASLGERFLKYQMINGHDYKPHDHIMAALKGMAHSTETDEHIREIVAGYSVKYDLREITIPEPPDWIYERLIALAQLIGHLRATVPRTYGGDIAYKPSPEIGTRLAKQLLKLGKCLSIIQQTKGLKIDKPVYRLMERVALDTATGWNRDILLMAIRNKGVSHQSIRTALGLPPTNVTRKLETMTMLGLLHRVRNPSGSAGQPEFLYQPTPNILDLWKKAKVGDCGKHSHL